jgi:hypothetical protein
LESPHWTNPDPQNNFEDANTRAERIYGERQCALRPGARGETPCTNNSNRPLVCDGYCGEASIQESTLFFGPYISQGVIRRALKFNDIESAREILIDTDHPNLKPDLAKTAVVLGLGIKSKWYDKSGGTSGFYDWAVTQLKNQSPLILGLIASSSAESTYDHITTAVSYSNDQ